MVVDGISGFRVLLKINQDDINITESGYLNCIMTTTNGGNGGSNNNDE